jgi:hypothetical protein
LGCYNDDGPLTLWCSEKTWNSILSQNKIINNLVEGLDNSSNWMAKIKEIQIKKPNCPLTRPKLCNYLVKPSNNNFVKGNSNFVLDIFYPELEEEI